MSSAKAKSLSVAPPKMSSDAIGSSVMNVVASDRGIVSHSETLVICAERAAPHERDVLPDAVEDDDRVVDRVAEHGQHRRHRGGRHLPAEQGVDADGDDDVVGEGDDRRHRELPLEAQRDVADDEEQRDDDREQGALRDLAAEARGHVLDAERVGLDRPASGRS